MVKPLRRVDVIVYSGLVLITLLGLWLGNLVIRLKANDASQIIAFIGIMMVIASLPLFFGSYSRGGGIIQKLAPWLYLIIGGIFMLLGFNYPTLILV